MTQFTRINSSGKFETGTAHPEVAEASLACLKRDLKKMRKTKGKSFFRKPYADLQEAQMIGTNEGSPPSRDIAGIMVISLVSGDTNARMPMTQDMVESTIASDSAVDFWSAQTKSGFA